MIHSIAAILMWVPAILGSMPDFSHAGYHGAEAVLPEVQVVATASPQSGDNTAYLQAIIDSVGRLPLDANGHRGALLLNPGVYTIQGTLKINQSGVVMRGSGATDDPAVSTILRAIGDTPHQRDVICMGASSRIWGSKQKSGTKQFVTDDSIPMGACTLHVKDASAFHVGDPLIIYHPCTEAWLQAVNYGGVPYPDPSAPSDPDERWTVDQLPIIYHRYITNVSGNAITFDAPVFYTLRKALSASYVYVPDMSGTITECGLENLRIEVISNGGTDENHAWQAVRIRSAENMWVRDCSMTGFGQSAVITEACRRSTIYHCNAVDPVAIVTGERMYNFNTYLYSQLNLFEQCYARSGRHHYVSNGTSTTSGNVFLECVSDNIQNANEGHRQWTQGMLYDCHREQNLCRAFVIGLYNRVAMGTGHGWAAVNSVLWNCDVDASYGVIGLQQPPTAQNYAVGCFAKKVTGQPVSATNFPIGYVEGLNQPGISIPSLYRYQWQMRHSGTDIASEQAASAEPHFEWYNGLLCIRRGERLYTLTGQYIKD